MHRWQLLLFPTKAIKECGLMDEDRFPFGLGDAQYTMRKRLRGVETVD
jgi:hypothetical protein